MREKYIEHCHDPNLSLQDSPNTRRPLLDGDGRCGRSFRRCFFVPLFCFFAPARCFFTTPDFARTSILGRGAFELLAAGVDVAVAEKGEEEEEEEEEEREEEEEEEEEEGPEAEEDAALFHPRGEERSDGRMRAVPLLVRVLCRN